MTRNVTRDRSDCQAKMFSNPRRAFCATATMTTMDRILGDYAGLERPGVGRRCLNPDRL